MPSLPPTPGSGDGRSALPRTAGGEPGAPGGPGQVWIVDDSPLQAERISRLLAGRFGIECFSDGERMLERLSEGGRPDLVLLDWQLPGLSGLEACRFLRERHDEVSLPILMLTARDARADFAEGLAAGANDYLAKPYDDAELLARVATLVRVHQQGELLRLREQWQATLLRSIGDAVIATNAAGGITFLNPVAEQLTGWSREQAQGQSIASVFRLVNANTRAEVESPVERVLREGVGVGLANHSRLIRKDGTELPIDDSASPIRGSRGELAGVVLVFRDVSEKKRVEEVLERRARHSRLIADVGQALTRVGDKREMLQKCAQALVEHLGAAFARVWLLDETGCVLRLEASAGLYTHLDGPHGRVPLGQLRVGLIAREGKPHLTNAVFDDPQLNDHDWARREGMVAFAGHPLRVGEKCVGVVALFSRSPLPQATLEVLEQVAGMIALGVERLRAEDENRRLLRLAETALDKAEAERQRLHDVFMQAPVGICILEGPEHTFSFANPDYRALVGGREVVGQPLLKALPELGGQGFEVLLDRVLASGEPFFGNEVRAVVDRGGTGTPVEGFFNFVYSPMRDAQGQVQGVVVSAMDVTEQALAHRRVEELAIKLRESEESLRRVLDASGAGLWALDAGTGRIAAEGSTLSLLGLPSGMAFGLETALSSVHPEDRERVSRAVEAALAGDQGGRYLETFRTVGRGDARERWVESRGTRVFDGDGRPSGLAGAMVDVTARKQAEADREEFLRALKVRAEFEQHLLGIVSHDLRNPLNAILFSASTLASAPTAHDPRAAKAVARIQSSAERATRMIRDLLDFTQARLGGGIRLARRPADLREIVQGVLDEVQAAHPGRELEVRHDGAAQGSWDSDRIGQVVQNLVSNAISYSPQESRVQVATRAGDGWVSLCVHNQGAGIAPDKLPQIFEPLQRAVAAGDRSDRSVGLGLYIVKHIVEAHGGNITVASTAERGTTFEVRLPLA